MLRRNSLVASRQLKLCTARTTVPSSSRIATATTCLPCLNYRRNSSTATNQPASPPPLQLSVKTSKSQPSGPDAVEERFGRLGLNTNVSRQLAATHPFIEKPTPAQVALVPAILSPIDVILRAQTGTGKSFGILLALLSKPRIVFKVKDDEEGSVKGKPLPSSSPSGKRDKIQAGIASIIVVPSNELAAQYLRWAQDLFPKTVLPSLDPIVQCLVRGGLDGPHALTSQEEMQRLKDNPPHILVVTPGRLADILSTAAGSSLLGVTTLRTLVLDEADAILQLPGRFPSAKQRWNHEIHKAPGLEVLNYFMRYRATYSGGEKHMSAGLENRPGKIRDERRPPEAIRRNTYKAAERRTSANTQLVPPLSRTSGVRPLQLICTSATANSVLRHFLAARTGWLRPGSKEADGGFGAQTGRWIDLTGLSGYSLVDQGIRGLFGDNSDQRSSELIEDAIEASSSMIPKAIEHTCVVVDEAPLSQQLARAPLRNFASSLARLYPQREDSSSSKKPKKFEDMLHVVKPSNEPAEHEVDQTLIEALAFTFASEGVDRGLALIPAQWSLLKTRASLEALGVTVRSTLEPSSLGDTSTTTPLETPELFLLQTTAARGLDIPSLTHVFLVGVHAVLDSVQYVHAAGRVSRIGAQKDQQRTLGKVVALIRGIPHNTPLPNFPDADESQADLEDGRPPRSKRIVSASELKMANIYKRLRITPRKIDLHLLPNPSLNEQASQGHRSRRSRERRQAEEVEVGFGEGRLGENEIMGRVGSQAGDESLEHGGMETATEEVVIGAKESEPIQSSPSSGADPTRGAGEPESDLEGGGREAATEELVMEADDQQSEALEASNTSTNKEVQ